MKQKNLYRDQSVEELKARCGELSRELFDLKSEGAKTRKMEKPHLVREKKRDRARVLTMLRQKGGVL